MKELFREEIMKIKFEVIDFEENLKKSESKKIEEERKKIIDDFRDVAILDCVIDKYHQTGVERYVNYAEHEDKIWLKEFLHIAIDNFMDADVVEEIAMLHYFTLNLHGYEAFRYLLNLYCICGLLRGRTAAVVFAKIRGIYPPFFNKQIEDELEKYRFVEDANGEEVTNLYESGLIPLLDRKQYFVVTMTEYSLKTMDEYFVSKMLRDLDEKQGALLMRGLSNKAAEKVRKNITSRLNVAIDEKLETMKGAKVEDIVNAMEQIFNQISMQMQEGK